MIWIYRHFQHNEKLETEPKNFTLKNSLKTVLNIDTGYCKAFCSHVWRQFQNKNKPFELFVSLTDEVWFHSRMSQTHVLINRRTLDRPSGVTVWTFVWVIEQVRHDMVPHNGHLVTAILAKATPIDHRSRCRRYTWHALAYITTHAHTHSNKLSSTQAMNIFRLYFY